MRTGVLVVDDSAFARSHLRELIVAGGCDVVGEAADAVEALDLFERLEPDVVTMDMNMPVLTGVDVILALRALRPDCRIILITAVREDPIIAGLFAMGIPVLHKPVSVAELSEVLAAA